MEDKHLDPRLKITQTLYDIKGMLLDIEHSLGNIPHEEEKFEDYSIVYTPCTEGDYIHPETPTHECPEGFGEEAYWDCIYQCWMMPNSDDEDEYNLATNIDTDANYDVVADEWMRTEENDWSNTWTEHMNMEHDEHIEDMHHELADEHHEETMTPKTEGEV
jgi:hypothetical protein